MANSSSIAAAIISRAKKLGFEIGLSPKAGKIRIRAKKNSVGDFRRWAESLGEDKGGGKAGSEVEDLRELVRKHRDHLLAHFGRGDEFGNGHRNKPTQETPQPSKRDQRTSGVPEGTTVGCVRYAKAKPNIWREVLPVPVLEIGGVDKLSNLEIFERINELAMPPLADVVDWRIRRSAELLLELLGSSGRQAMQVKAAAECREMLYAWDHFAEWFAPAGWGEGREEGC